MYRKSLEWGRRVVKGEAGKGKINIVLVDDESIRRLNKKFRGIDRATDVLSFEMKEDGILGEIIISKDTAKRNAERFGLSYKDEMKRLVIHGALHLLGYDHGAKSDRIRMRAKEELYAKKIR
jgi:probable rRNA maturation factor